MKKKNKAIPSENRKTVQYTSGYYSTWDTAKQELQKFGALPIYSKNEIERIQAGGITTTEYWWHEKHGMLFEFHQPANYCPSIHVEFEINSNTCPFYITGSSSRTPMNLRTGDCIQHYSIQLNTNFEKQFLNEIKNHTEPKLHHHKLTNELQNQTCYIKTDEDCIKIQNRIVRYPIFSTPINLKNLLEKENYQHVKNNREFIATKNKAKKLRYWWTLPAPFEGVIQSHLGNITKARQLKKEIEIICETIKHIEISHFENNATIYSDSGRILFTPKHQTEKQSIANGIVARLENKQVNLYTYSSKPLKIELNELTKTP